MKRIEFSTEILWALGKAKYLYIAKISLKFVYSFIAKFAFEFSKSVNF